METTKTTAPTPADVENPEDVTAADTATGAAKGETAGQPADRRPEADADHAAEASAAEAAAIEVPAAETEEADETETEVETDDADADETGLTGEGDDTDERSGGVGAAACAIVAAALGTVALSGSWVSRVAAERENLVNQLDLSATADNNAKIAALYSAPWHATALVNGVLATLALLLAVFVLARPAFGTPGRTLPTWIRSVAWAAVALGVLGILIFGLMYFDVLLPVPTAPAQPA
ncbi:MULTISPECIES: hypothetical protein [unclassified Streptomyces]|uniref:hypothetical protein n=1 Tax=unclassified Streptomyces TaxID=2593676 RepID=UPI001446B17B|nr:hypothetical protein [Streptomyces sp. A1136]